MPHSELTLIASRAIDRLVDINNQLIKTQLGGPAYYLANVFTKEKISFTSLSPEPLEVEIMISNDDEKGRVVAKPLPWAVSFTEIKTPVVVVSSIVDEIDISTLQSYSGQVFLDVQGFVRDGNSFGAKKMWQPSVSMMKGVTCLKTTAEEQPYLLPAIVENQKQAMLLVTHGTAGSILYWRGQEYRVVPQKVIANNHTIGAGDTLFAYFICALLRGTDPIESLQWATTCTSVFLEHEMRQ